MSDKCKCNLRTRLVGDGCHICNPQRTIELMQEEIEEQARLLAAGSEREARLMAEVERLRSAVDKKNSL